MINLARLQIEATRFVFNIYTNQTVMKTISNFKWGSLGKRRKGNILCMLYKIKNGLINIDCQQYTKSSDSRTGGKDLSIKKAMKISSSTRDWNLQPLETAWARTMGGGGASRVALKDTPRVFRCTRCSSGMAL